MREDYENGYFEQAYWFECGPTQCIGAVDRLKKLGAQNIVVLDGGVSDDEVQFVIPYANTENLEKKINRIKSEFKEVEIYEI